MGVWSAATAKASHAAALEQLSAEEQRREWERTREELHSTKRQLTERDEEVLQLKTALRKLQETLRKRDKDLQNVFAVLRAPQDAELTKKRRTEIIERLLMEAQQRALNAETIAEERKKELDRLKLSSKFLRLQELETEVDECHTEIERLRDQLSRFAVVGKLRLSVVPKESTVGGETRSKRAKHVSVDEPIRTASAIEPVVIVQTQEIRPLSTAKRGGFVEKTRRRAIELEYQKQMRLAQLEAECELEENMQIRAKREARAEAERRQQEQRELIEQRRREAEQQRLEQLERESRVVIEETDPVEAPESDVNVVNEAVDTSKADLVALEDASARRFQSKWRGRRGKLEANEAISPEKAVKSTVMSADSAKSDVVEIDPVSYEHEEEFEEGEEVTDQDKDTEEVKETVETISKEDVPREEDPVEDEVDDETEENVSKQTDPVVQEVAIDSEQHGYEEFSSEGSEDEERSGHDEPAEVEIAYQPGFTLDINTKPVEPVQEELPSHVLKAENVPAEEIRQGSLLPVGETEPVETQETTERGHVETGRYTEDEENEEHSTEGVETDDISATMAKEESAIKDSAVDDIKPDPVVVVDADEVTSSEDPDPTVTETSLVMTEPTSTDHDTGETTVDDHDALEQSAQAMQELEEATHQVHEQMEATLDVCDVVIESATQLTEHLISSALETDTIAPIQSIEATTLSADDLHAAMDAAARKIQQFWRDMERKFTPEPSTNPAISPDPEQPTTSSESASPQDSARSISEPSNTTEDSNPSQEASSPMVSSESDEE
ncbi:hypothetical protein Poli38472_005780 [Pythium oligandrum]|uniref:Uncharacterized protein n=1 Tax=Pythium oligandrum TaxID=41045 RepID=A0A8K1FQU2_PYTOL|nr:hypothetical protein Poli38472_005780 [Pythium oligandrum]|eukprot:TMW68312.1 hypothetical protein Poli38472_005780 [Pythium oligandrum]